MLGQRALLLGGVAALVLLGSVGAQAGDVLGGKGWLRGMSTRERTVVIGKSLYHLTARTRIRGMDDEPLELRELEGVPDFESLDRVPRHPRLWVAFDASRVGQRLELNWMQIESGDETMRPSPTRRGER